MGDFDDKFHTVIYSSSIPFYWLRGNICSNSEALASELEIIEEMFSEYYMHNDVFGQFKSLITQ